MQEMTDHKSKGLAHEPDAFAHSVVYLKVRSAIREHASFVIPIWRRIKRTVWRLRFHSPKRRFEEIYLTNTWACEESRSGEGSSISATTKTREAIIDFVKSHGIQSILDIPCGDYNWMKEVPFHGKYIGGDIVAQVIDQNQKRYGSENRRFQLLDITKDPFPECDLILSRDCLNHLAFCDIQRALKNLFKSNAKFLALTNFPLQKVNRNQESGFVYRELNFHLPPFDLPEPMVDYNEETHPGKHLAFWRLADLKNLR
jgi:SAM-dependent methyltransferase